MSDNKFSFDLAFQEEAIRFILSNDDGINGLSYVKSSYFALINHSIIVYAIEKCFKKYARIPSRPLLLELTREIFNEKDYREAFTKEERKEVIVLIKDLYKKAARDGDVLLKKLAQFASYVELKNTVERLDLDNFAGYERFSTDAAKAIQIADPINLKPKGLYLIKGIQDRQLQRQSQELVIPTPFYQLNRLTSAGGYSPGSIIVLLDQPKRLKTAFLVNVSRKYLASKKRILYIDMENGEGEIMSRLEQSIGRVSKLDIIRGTKDKEIQKVLRRYRRLGGEVYVRRIPAFSTAHDIQVIIDEVYRKEGIKFEILIIDYLALMGALSHKMDDYDRISDAYIDVANLALRNHIQHVYTANHVVRTASKRQSSKYVGEDIAKCIDIVRHAQSIFGLNRTVTEFENNVVRLEVVEQREGKPTGRAYFKVDMPTQRVDELTRKEIDMLNAADILYNPDSRVAPPKPSKTHGDV